MRFLKRALLLVLMLCTSLSLSAQWNVAQLLRQGQSAVFNDDNTAAIEHFNRIISLKPYLPEPYFFRGLAKLNLEDFNGALSDFTLAIDKSPNYLFAYIYRGITYFEMRRFEEALSDYKYAVELDPSNSVAYAYRGAAYAELGDLKRAEADYTKSIRLNDKQQFAYLNRAVLREECGDYDGAMADCNAVIKQNIFSDLAYGLRGYIYSKRGDMHHAIEDFNMGIKANPENLRLRMNKAMVWYEMERYDDVMEEYNEILAIDSNYIYALYNRALLNMTMEDYGAAVADFTRVLDLNPENIVAYLNRGLAYGELGENVRAYNDFSEGIRLYPDFVYAYFARADLLEREGRDVAAAQDRYTASSIMDRYRRMREGDPSAFVDTTENFTRLLDLHERNDVVREMVSGRVQDRQAIVRLRGIYRVVAMPTDSLYIDGVDRFLPTLAIYNASAEGDLKLALAERNLDVTMELPDDITDTDERHFVSGVINLNSAKYMDAISDFSAVSEDSPLSLLARFNLTNARFLMYLYIETIGSRTILSGESDESRKVDYGDVLADYDRCLEEDPTFVYALFNKATVLAESGEIDEASELYTRVIELAPDMAGAYFNRGILYIYNGDKRKAATDLGRAGELGITESYNIIKRYCSDV